MRSMAVGQLLELGDERRVEGVVGIGDRLREQLVLGAEVVDDAGGAHSGALGDVGEAHVPQAVLADQLDRGGEDLRTAHVVETPPRPLVYGAA